MKKITVTVTPDGETSIKTEGFKGPECKAATADLEKALGKVTSDIATPEMHYHGDSKTTHKQ